VLVFANPGSYYLPIFMTNMEEANQSWQKMLDAGAWIVYPSHGKSFPATLLRENMGKIKTQDCSSVLPVRRYAQSFSPT